MAAPPGIEARGKRMRNEETMANRLLFWVCLPVGILLLAWGMALLSFSVSPRTVTNWNQCIESIVAGLALINLCEIAKRISALEGELRSFRSAPKSPDS